MTWEGALQASVGMSLLEVHGVGGQQKRELELASICSTQGHPVRIPG